MSFSISSSSALPLGPCWCVITIIKVSVGGVRTGAEVQTCRLTILSLAAPADWFMSLGVGLLTFASLETVGIYFGLGKTFAHSLWEGSGWAGRRGSPRAGKPRPKLFIKISLCLCLLPDRFQGQCEVVGKTPWKKWAAP